MASDHHRDRQPAIARELKRLVDDCQGLARRAYAQEVTRVHPLPVSEADGTQQFRLFICPSAISPAVVL